MTTRATQASGLQVIATVIAIAFLAAACQRDEERPMQVTQRFIVELAENQAPASIEAAAEGVLDARYAVEALFPSANTGDDPYGLSRIYRLSTDGEAAQQAPWDFAYRLRDKGRFVTVEPDLNTTVNEFERAERSAACLGDDGVAAPADPSWSLRDIRAPQAWALTPAQGGKAFGEGVRVCHPDTGWTQHVDLDQARIDLAGALNILDGNGDARDPLGYSGHPGHGTGTGSVIMSAGGVGASNGTTPPGRVTGVAPAATLVPIRTIKSVVQVFDSDVARAVRHAVDARCDVISMSLGGRAFFGLERAIKDAVRRDVIVVTAAGNCVGFVVSPASYDESIAVAATNAARKPWLGSSRGRSIEIAAPGEDVYIADAQAGTGDHVRTRTSNGTSYSTAEIAGTAANWIAFHGADAIRAAQGGGTRRDLFVRLMQASASRPQGWEAQRYGAGIVDVAALLQLPLGSAGTERSAASSANDAVSILARQFDRDPEEVRGAVARLLQVDAQSRTDVDQTLDRYGPEIQYLATRDPQAFLAVLDAPAGETVPSATARQSASARFMTRASSALQAAGR